MIANAPNSSTQGPSASDPRLWSQAQWDMAAAALNEAVQEQAAQTRALTAAFAPWGAEQPSAADIRAAYEKARQALIEERYADAVSDFAALCAVRPDQFPFAFGMGLGLQMLGHTRAARDAYAAAYLLDPRDPACLLRLGECLLALHEVDQARQAWHAGLKQCQRPGTDPLLQGLLHAALDRL
jgi:tetratricopeptide (TPR) repeat protein